MTSNPLLQPWTDNFGAPPFSAIKTEDFRPAFDAAMAEQRAAIDGIAGNADAPTFDNTVVAMEKSGLLLDQVSNAFFHLAGADTTDELEAIERDIAPVLARHGNEIALNGPLFKRIDALWQNGDTLGLDPEQKRVLDRYHLHFVRAGAKLDPDGKKRFAAINERLALLGTLFGQNVLADEKAWTLVIEGEADLAGLPQWLRDDAAQAARDRGMEGKHVITLSRSSVEPFLQFSERRDLREKAFAAWTRRGENGGSSDNRALMAETIALRHERAALLGYKTYADFKLADTMAKTPQAAGGLLQSVWSAGRARAEREAEDLQAVIADEGSNHKLAAADWRHYAEKLRKRRFDFDGAELKPYLQLEKMIEAAFYTASRLFGLSFEEITDVSRYNPDVRVWKVMGRNGRHVGLFYGDYFARPSKRSGAWMSAFRDQQRLEGDVTPIVVNVMNFSKPSEGESALLSFDDARTLFHEFGHALHGLLSDVTYPAISGTRVATDFVELPSQLFEHWLEQPEILRRFAIHANTGESMPQALLDKVLAARTFNQGFATVEYTSSALVDMDLHIAAPKGEIDVIAAEKATLDRIDMPETISMRHRTPHFQHIFSGEGYAAGYYSYLWSEVLDADAFEAFKETGDIFDPGVARRLHEFIYSAGYRRDPAEAYRAFRGRDPDPAALLKKRGLDALIGMDDAAAVA